LKLAVIDVRVVCVKCQVIERSRHLLAGVDLTLAAVVSERLDSKRQLIELFTGPHHTVPCQHESLTLTGTWWCGHVTEKNKISRRNWKQTNASDWPV